MLDMGTVEYKDKIIGFCKMVTLLIKLYTCEYTHIQGFKNVQKVSHFILHNLIARNLLKTLWYETQPLYFNCDFIDCNVMEYIISNLMASSLSK